MKRYAVFVLVVTSAACDLSVEPESVVPPVGAPSFAIMGPVGRLSAGGFHTCGIGSDGSVSCWGSNADGQTDVPKSLGSVSHVSAGGAHTCAIETAGTVVCWGRNAVGQSTVPETLGSVSQVSAGGQHTCAVKTDGSVACWGWNGAGQTSVPAGLGSVSQVSAGNNHTCALESDGRLSCWGSNGAGQASVPIDLGTISEVSAGGLHTCALDDEGDVACWGHNQFGQTSVPVDLGSASKLSAGYSHTCMLRVDGTSACWGSNFHGQASPPANLGIVSQVSSGNYHTCALKSDGSVACWGIPTADALVRGTFAEISPGDGHACAVATDGSLTCWGQNHYGQSTVPADLGSVSQVTAGGQHTCALETDASLACWGNNGSGQTSVPIDLGSVSQVAAGASHTCAVTTAGIVTCWGFNGSGQTDVPADLASVSQVSAGQNHTCATGTDGTPTCWGWNASGQISPPAGIGSILEVRAGYNHTCALKSNGTISCWGSDQYGESSAPADLGSVSQVSAGIQHTCALKNDGSIYCWGRNDYGQSKPPADLGTASQVEAGNVQTCAVVTDGTIECWGRSMSTTYIPGTLAPGATPTGTDVSVAPIDQTTGTTSPTTITFDEVTASGETTVISGEIGGAGSAPAPDGNFRLGQPPTYYDITTTATYSGTITVCLDYSGVSYGNETQLKLLHYENGAWVDVTSSLDMSTNTICGTTTSLSPFLVAEKNLAPVVEAILLPGDPLRIGAAATIAARFSDLNPTDVHAAIIDWEETSTSGSVSETAGAGTLSGSHTYAAAGLYTIDVSVGDGFLSGSRSSALDIPAYIAVYDPEAGSVTGGGWIDSPAGACNLSTCATDGSTAGKVTFGFISRYNRRATTPDGNTELQFEAGGLSFKSTSYAWLVVSGNRAQYMGEGTINGSGAYGFLVTAIDGALTSGSGSDKFRIKIWEKPTGHVVYDNQRDEAEDSDAATELGGGSIVIQR